MRAATITAAAALALAACTARESDELILEQQDERAIAEFNRAGHTVYYLGESFEGHRLASVLHHRTGLANFLSFSYGDCAESAAFGDDLPCAVPLSVQVSPLAERHPSRLNGRCFRTRARGLPARIMPGEDAVSLYTRQTIVTVGGNQPSQVQRAVQALRPIRADGAAAMPPPPAHVVAALERCTPMPLIEALEAST